MICPHLQEFMGAQFQENPSLKNDLEDFLRLTDNEVLASLRLAAYDSGLSGHSAARRIEERRHFKKVLEITAADRMACRKWIPRTLQTHSKTNQA